jgi:hypothetical protein
MPIGFQICRAKTCLYVAYNSELWKVLPQRLRKEAAAGSVKRKVDELGGSATTKVTRKSNRRIMKDETLVLPIRRRASSVKSTAPNTITRRFYAENAGLLCAKQKWIDPQMRGAVEAASTSMGIVVITDNDASPGPREGIKFPKDTKASDKSLIKYMTLRRAAYPK